MEISQEWEKLKDLINGDGSRIKQQLLFAGLFILIFEQFKKFAIATVDRFFSPEIALQEGNIVYKRGEEFKKIIKAFGSGEKGQHKNVDFRAAVAWFQGFDAISKEDLDRIEQLYLIRNDIGHELFGVIVDDNKCSITIDDINFIYSVYLKTVRWWVKEVDASTNPYFIEHPDINAFNFEQAETFETLVIKELLYKVLFKD